MPSTGILLVEVRVRNFRCLAKIDLPLASMTVLIGENNSGKTSFLEAIHAAIGSGTRTLNAEDIFIKSSETHPPKDRTITIDILIRPAEDGKIIDKFPEGFWLALWGSGVAQDKEDNDFVAIRTQLKWHPVKAEYIVERKFLNDWQADSSKLDTSKAMGDVHYAQVEPFALFLLDAKRDVYDDLRSKGSFWHHMVSDHGLPDEQVKLIESSLSELNTNIISSSEVLAHVQKHLNDLYGAIPCKKGSVSITPVPRHMRDLSKGMDVVFSTKDASSFPISRHGMGTRSLAAVLIFRAFVSWRFKKAKGETHPLFGLEEPEAHLHPQAQRALFRQLASIEGQRIVSTHSPHICGEAEILNYRHFRRTGEETVVSYLRKAPAPLGLTDEDLRKINRMVIHTRGEMLFARGLLFFSGETEDAAIPIFGETFWKRHHNELGIDLISVGGDGNYLPFITLAKSFGIPWAILSDGEPKAISDLNVALEKVGEPKCDTNAKIIVLPDGKDFEQYVVCETYRECLVNMIIEMTATCDKHKTALKDEWSKKPDQLNAIHAEMDKHKARNGVLMAKAITSLPDESKRIPAHIKKALTTITVESGLSEEEFR